ncbi:MAG: VanZ family protein [Archangium sp.]|nr:VanZ family protein [Archangium sp.]MDP3569304.1 VanZ family protein [Archangium sp.]
MTPRTARITLATLLLGIYSTLSVARQVSNALRDAGLLRATVATAFGVAALAVIVFLVRHPSLRTPRTLFATLGVALVYGAVIFPMSSPEEKLHFLEYGAVGVLAFFAAKPGWSTSRRFLFAVLFTLAAGWLDEGIQALLPTRHYDLRDVGFNALAGVMALTAFAFIRWSANSQRLAVVLAVLALPHSAQAMLKWVYDVPGLSLKSQAIVVAEHVDAGRYRIKESVRGELKPGAEIAVPDDGYETTWEAGEREVVLFLAQNGSAWNLVSSGLRQRRQGQMHRFEQRRNPGLFEAQPEGRDLDAFVKEVRAALALQPRDLTKRRTAARSLLPAAIPAEMHSFAFIDERARRVLTVLAAGGDLESTLELMPRDRSTAPFPRRARVAGAIALLRGRPHSRSEVARAGAERCRCRPRAAPRTQARRPPASPAP